MTNLNYAVPPGAFLEEWIDEHELTQQRVAERLGSSRKFVNELVKGRAPITSETALKLERVVGISADTWLRYEAAYRAAHARLTDSEDLASHVQQIHPKAAKYLRDLGRTKATVRSPGQLVSDFLAFHGCGTWEAYERQIAESSSGDFALAAHKEHKSQLDASLVSVWLKAAELTSLFEHGRRMDFSPDALTSLLPTLRDRVSKPDAEMLNDVSAILAQAGVLFLVKQPPEGLPLRGMTRWVDKRVPVIQLTGRWANDGFLIWTLFHEVGHVLNDPRGSMAVEFTTERKRSTAAEKGANTFALSQLLGPDGMHALGGVSRDWEIRERAKELRISPGLAVFLLHRSRLLDYKFGNKLCVNLSDTFTLGRDPQ